MVFNSFVFLFTFLPIVLLSYFICKKRNTRNIILLIFSLLFYAWGEPIYILLMILSIVCNYWLAIFIDKFEKNKNIILVIDLIFNIFIIAFFKYGNFIIDNLNLLLLTSIPNLKLSLPIGISFYTFQILSYVIDVYRKKVPVQKNILYLGTYITLFPQLIAGPIVRYETIANELENRKENFNDISEGIKRFIIGLAKKVLIANQMALIADTIYSGDLKSYGTFVLWLAAFAYTFQIYFDFSGYSDMAIGLGKIFGFHFLENFNYPYIATSITDFWRRWHISLSSWFRDYVYIPLGGNRVSRIKWLRNILIVWILTGLWHGASWNFIIWGLYYGILLVVEKVILNQYIEKWPKFFQHLYTLILVVVGWVIFRMENFQQMGIVISKMFIFTPSNIFNDIILSFDIFSSLPYLIVAIICSLPIWKNISTKLKKKTSFYIIQTIIIFIVYVISLCFLLSSTYNPFIYFRF